jgi:hypothetical protein
VFAIHLSVLSASAAHGAEWTAENSASISTAAESNPGLRIGDSPARSSLAIDASANLARRTEISELTLQPLVHLIRYPSEKELDREEGRVKGSFTLTGERSDYALDASFARESTLTSELGTTGRVDIDAVKKSTSFAVAPGWSLTERLTVDARMAHERSAYVESGNAELYGTRYTSGSVNLKYGLSPSMSLSLGASAGKFASDRAGASSENANVTVALNYAIAERLTIALSAGPSRVRARGRSDDGAVYEVSLARTFPLARTMLTASRSTSPAGFGVLTQRDEARLSWSRPLSEWTTANLGFSTARTSELLTELGLSFGTVRYWRADAGLSRRLGDAWHMAFGISGFRQTSAVGSRPTKGYEGRLAINWRGDTHVL